MPLDGFSEGFAPLASLQLPYAPGTVHLLVRGMLYDGWTTVEVRRSVKEMAGEFSLTVEERWTGGAGGGGPASLMEWRIRPGDPCQIFYQGVLVLTGHVDAYNPRYTATSHSVTIQGRSKTGDLCDSSAIVPNGEMNDVTLDQVARKAIEKYGIGLEVDADVRDVFDKVSVWPGETVHRFLDRYARPGAVALTDTPQGNLRLLHVKGGAAAASVTEGVNILEASAMLRADNRHSEINVLGQDRGTDGEYGKPVAQRRSRTQDGAVKRHRPLVLLNETKTSRHAAKSRAAWESAKRSGESTRVEVKVVDWFYAPGKVWETGMTVMCTSPMLAVERPLALENVTLTLSANGTIAALSLVPVEALNPGAGGGGNKGDKAWGETKPAAEPEDLTASDDGLNY